MKQYLIPNEGNFYKANMHTHSTFSDGCNSVEKIKEMYKAHGYSVVAFTDHNIMVDHSDLNDDEFLAITSYELDTNDPPRVDNPDIRTYHINFYAKDPHTTTYPCANPKYAWGRAGEYVQDYYKGDYQRRYGIEGQNEMIAEANAKGFLVCYNHPSWSLQSHEDFAGLEGLCALECYNTGCEREGFVLDMTEYVYHDMLCRGKRIYPMAADDSHGDGDCFGGWVRFKAPALEYGAIMNAYEKGDFYASWGPDFESLYLEDGILKMDFTPSAKVYLTTERRFAIRIVMTDEPLTHAEFDIRSYLERSRGYDLSKLFFRVTIVDEKGDKALSRGYFLDELDPSYFA